ncbi:MAG TPA: restriction endonuclease [Flavobacterium sp.]|nr:restriction endonuclease [Flavobacterium sp.]
MNNIKVKKQDGELTPFNATSLRKSLLQSGASETEADLVYEKVTQDMYDGIGTKELYGRAFAELKKVRRSFAARYSLKAAIKQLGPEGYHFEKWIAKIFQKQGMDAVTSQTLQGCAVTHEVDVLAAKNDELWICECKFRNDDSAKIGVTTPMYFLSRFNDLKPNTFDYFGKQLRPAYGCLITNAHFTSDSIDFANYYAVELLSWSYPEDRNIKSLTEKFGLYPITCLTTLNEMQKQMMLSKNCLLVREIVDNPVLLEHFNFKPEIRQEILEEATELCGIKM